VVAGLLRTQDRRASAVPLAPATSGPPRSLADALLRRSGHVEAETAQIPKLTVWPSLQHGGNRYPAQFALVQDRRRVRG
jgi:hypothetical protein